MKHLDVHIRTLENKCHVFLFGFLLLRFFWGGREGAGVVGWFWVIYMCVCGLFIYFSLWITAFSS